MQMLDILGIPKECFFHTKIPKKAFLDNPNFNMKKAEKDILRDFVESIYLEFSIRYDNINIMAYEDNEKRYEEIQFLKIIIKDMNKEKKVVEFLQKYISYPMVIFVEFKNKLMISTEIKKINKLENEKLLLEEIISTNWIEKDHLNEKENMFFHSLNIKNLNKNNLYTLYKDMVNRINILNICKYKEEFKVSENIDNDKIIFKKIEEIDKEIYSLKEKLKKEKL